MAASQKEGHDRRAIAAAIDGDLLGTRPGSEVGRYVVVLHTNPLNLQKRSRGASGGPTDHCMLAVPQRTDELLLSWHQLVEHAGELVDVS
jgi:hypothetical protein